jgi:hypothetical protein
MSEGQRKQSASSQREIASPQRPDATVDTSLPTARAFPQRAIWQILIAVFVLPRFGELIQFFNENSLTVRSWQSRTSASCSVAVCRWLWFVMLSVA